MAGGAKAGVIDREFVERYLTLGLRLGRHIEGFVDAYYGPPELSSRVADEAVVPAAQLAAEAVRLRDAMAGEEGSQRSRWMLAQLDGLAATAERLDGRTLDYLEEVRRCYGVEVTRADEDELARAHDQLGKVLGGGGSLPERYQAWRREHDVPPDRILPALEALNVELRSRTRDLFGLPEGEAVELETVSNEPWSGFNYYAGKKRSRVVMNTDVPMTSQFLVEAAAHESYPGHHTEHVWKEVLFVDEKGHLEETIFLIGTPQSTVAEGIATTALTALGTDAEDACSRIVEGLGIRYDLETSRAVREAMRPLGRVLGTVAVMIHQDGRDVEEARRYASRWLLDSDQRIAKHLEFITHASWRAYAVIYDIAERLVEAWTQGDPARHRRLLTEQITAADLSSAAG